MTDNIYYSAIVISIRTIYSLLLCLE